ncbi:hypothetical protein [Xanthomonas phage DES1]|nr:hypothetical protein [Xanthomonas phage DES1]
MRRNGGEHTRDEMGPATALTRAYLHASQHIGEQKTTDTAFNIKKEFLRVRSYCSDKRRIRASGV